MRLNKNKLKKKNPEFSNLYRPSRANKKKKDGTKIPTGLTISLKSQRKPGSS